MSIPQSLRYLHLFSRQPLNSYDRNLEESSLWPWHLVLVLYRNSPARLVIITFAFIAPEFLPLCHTSFRNDHLFVTDSHIEKFAFHSFRSKWKLKTHYEIFHVRFVGPSPTCPFSAINEPFRAKFEGIIPHDPGTSPSGFILRSSLPAWLQLPPLLS